MKFFCVSTLLLLEAIASASAPNVTLSVASVAFPEQVVKTISTPVSVTLTNTGDAPLQINSIASAGSFQQSNNCPASLAAGAFCSINITFQPTVLGTATGTVSVVDDASNSPQAIGLSGTGIRGVDQIKHIVFIVKENRSFDNYFSTFPGADGATSCTLSTGQVISLRHTPDRVRDMGHSWGETRTAMDGGKMDKFDLVQNGNLKGDYMTCSQLYEQDIPNYFAYARAFVLGDLICSSMTGPSFPQHLYTVAAGSGGVFSNPTNPAMPLNTWGWMRPQAPL